MNTVTQPLLALSTETRLTVILAANEQKRKTNKDRLRECELERSQNQEEMEAKKRELEEFESQFWKGLRFFQSLTSGIPSKSHIEFLNTD
jgi:hypothetical protein